MWKDDGRWRKLILSKIYNFVKNMFDFYVIDFGNRGNKLFEQQIWELVYWKLKKRK